MFSGKRQKEIKDVLDIKESVKTREYMKSPEVWE